jgi:hypothetical protein
MIFTFRVLDSEGLYGDVRVVGPDEADARELATSYLRAECTPPHGTLDSDFTLVLTRTVTRAIIKWQEAAS